MGYKATVDLLVLEDLRRRAREFAEQYDPGLDTVVLVPGGMGSRLLKTLESYQPGVPFPAQPTFQKLWLSFAAVLHGDIDGLRMTRGEHDRGDRPVIASGEVSSRLAKKYDNTREFFTGGSAEGLRANYVVFGYDWRKSASAGAAYLRQFLLFLKDAVGGEDPRPRTTLLGHSLGGLVIKLFLNDLVDGGERPSDWMERFVSVATPFYGTQNHLRRYYRGVKLINLFTPGGRRFVTDLVWSLPGPYVLLPAPRAILGPRLDDLGLDGYPVVDRDQPTHDVDPFAAAQRRRLPGFMTGSAQDRAFTVSRLKRAARELAEVDRELAGLEGRVFHLRSTLRESAVPRSFRVLWQDVDGASYDIENGPDPVSDNGGDADGTVPLWSARLAWTPPSQVITFKGLKHGGLAEHPHVLEAVAKIMAGEEFVPPAVSQELAVGDEAEALALLQEVRAGRLDVEDLAAQRPEMQRRFEAMFELV